jgi:hypothetical protein
MAIVSEITGGNLIPAGGIGLKPVPRIIIKCSEGVGDYGNGGRAIVARRTIFDFIV